MLAAMIGFGFLASETRLAEAGAVRSELQNPHAAPQNCEGQESSSGVESQSILVRLLWVRHGLSCANVLDDCTTQNVTSLPQPWTSAVERTLRQADRSLGVDWAWGLKPRGWVDGRGEPSPDCAVKLVGLPATVRGSPRLNATLGVDGDVVRVHDLFRDPALTACSIHQSRKAGEALAAFLAEKGWSLDLIGRTQTSKKRNPRMHIRCRPVVFSVFTLFLTSSFCPLWQGSSTLLRAAQTAWHMFLERSTAPGAGSVVQLPFIDERAPAAMTALQLDNAPNPVRQQRARLGRGVRVDGSLVDANELLDALLHFGRRSAFPRGAHDWPKFKAFLGLALLPRLLGLERREPLRSVARAVAAAAGPFVGGPPLSVGRGASYAEGPGVDPDEVAARERGSAGQRFDRVLTLAVVGHGAMIRKHCLGEASRRAGTADPDGRVESQVKANNNAVYEKLFVVELSRELGANGRPGSKRSVVLREALGDCPLVMDAPTRATSMAATTAADLATCDVPFDVKPLLHLASHDHSARTPCEAAADAPGAFPIRYGEVTPRHEEEEIGA